MLQLELLGGELQAAILALMVVTNQYCLARHNLAPVWNLWEVSQTNDRWNENTSPRNRFDI
jgi:hypothetical protein